jgi:hypothetical protein
MSDNIYTYLRDKFGITDDFKYKRDYIIDPLQKCIREPIRNQLKFELPYEEDFRHLYLEINLRRAELCKLFKVSDAVIVHCLEKYNIKKDKKLALLNTQKTNIKLYGVPYTSSLEEVKKKVSETNIKRYGYKSSFQNKEVQEKQRKTVREKYGVDNVFQNEMIKEKSKKTLEDRYGVDHYSKCDKYKEQIKETSQKIYGVNHFATAKEIREKIETTNQERYGVACIFNKDDFREQSKKTMIEKYGAEYFPMTDEYKQKTKQTNLEKYGSEWFVSSQQFDEHREEYQEKAVKTLSNKIKNRENHLSVEENELLEKVKIIYPSAISQWREDSYPGIADIYIPETNTIIEYQGSWVHGPTYITENGIVYSAHCPYDDLNETHRKIVEIMKNKNSGYFERAIMSWTIKDPNKRKWAKEHPQYIWVEFFSLDEFNEWLNKRA